MPPPRTRRSEVVDVIHLTDDREDDVLGHLRSGSSRRPGDEAKSQGEEEDPSGCRPVASHTGGRALRFALEGSEVSIGFGLSRVRDA
jgi:hypothetical protein